MPLTTWITMGIGGSSEYFADTTGEEDLRTNTHNAGYYDGSEHRGHIENGPHKETDFG